MMMFWGGGGVKTGLFSAMAERLSFTREAFGVCGSSEHRDGGKSSFNIREINVSQTHLYT